MKYVSDNSWHKVLASEYSKEYFVQLMAFIDQEYQCQTIYPARQRIFEAFEWTPYDEVKVVILGQDPYHGANQAHGLSFSVLPGNKVPPSLHNIYKELADDLGYAPAAHGYLKNWAQQGVLLLNTVLTVRAGEANSHRGRGWEIFTDEVIAKLNERRKPIVFILWGKQAEIKGSKIDTSRHLVLTAPHPSPLSAYRGFFGTKPFSKANKKLMELGAQPVNWELRTSV